MIMIFSWSWYFHDHDKYLSWVKAMLLLAVKLCSPEIQLQSLKTLPNFSRNKITKSAVEVVVFWMK